MVGPANEPIQNASDAPAAAATTAPAGGADRPDVRRAGRVALVLAALAAVALVAAPHAVLVDAQEAGTTTEVRFWWDQLAWDASHDAVLGAGALLGALAAAVLVVGAVLVQFALRRPASRGLLLGGLGTFLAGAVGTLHYGALWTSRLLTTVVHAVAGFDAPPALMRHPDFPPDAYSLVWVVGPALALGLALAAAFVLLRALPGLPALAADDHGQSVQARRHLRAAALALLTLAAVFALPWSVQTLPDNHTGWEGAATDDDAFWFGAYDAARVHDGTTAVAERTNEFGLVQYGELAQVLAAVLGGVVLVCAAAVAGLHGALRGSDGDRNLGNLWHGSVYVGLLANAVVFLAVALGALWLHHPNADIPDRATYLPLLAALPTVLGILGQLHVARSVAGEGTTLLADDFPEPVVYE